MYTESSTDKSTEDKSNYWSQRIKDWEDSGLTQKTFCSENNLSYAAFGYWRKRFSDTSPKDKQSFVSVQMSPSSKPSVKPCIRIRMLSGMLLELPLELSKLEIKELLSIIKEVL